MLDMCDSLQYQVLENNIEMSAKLFDSLVTQYTESQSWNKVKDILEKVDHHNCDPTPRIVGYLKKNLVYCFDTNLRALLKESINSFEMRFFSNEQRAVRQQAKEKRE